MADRFALLVGSYEYAQEPGLQRLQCPPNDIAALERVLGDAQIGGFAAQTSVNEPFTTVLERVEDFLAERHKDDVALLYFSGHGIKADGELYFAMANTRLKRLLSTALKARIIQDALRGSRARQQLLLLDCCHSGAVPRGMVVRSGSSVGTQDYFDGRGHVVLTASDAVQYAFEEGEAKIPAGEMPQSIFTRALVDGLASGSADRDGDGVITVDELYDHLHEQVRSRTPGQTPCKWAMDQQGKLVVARVAAAKVKPVPLSPELLDTMVDRRHWIRQSAIGELVLLLMSGHPGRALAGRKGLEALVDDDSRSVSSAATQALQQHPLDDVANKADAAVTHIAQATAQVDARLERVSSRQPPEPIPKPVVEREPISVFRDRLQDSSDGPALVVIPLGEFLMGSPAKEADRYEREGRQHRVSIKSFALGQTAVTFDDYDRFAQATNRTLPEDCGWGRSTRPVIHVTWKDATAYAQWLSAQTGEEYRLPSEAEWEYAARAGTTTRYSTGDNISSSQANFGNEIGKTQPVGSYPANPFGLHEMHGNVWEWVGDCCQENYKGAPEDGSVWLIDSCTRRVLRGGSWINNPLFLRSAFRYWNTDDEADDYIGFRLARTL